MVPASSGLQSRGEERSTERIFCNTLIRLIRMAKDVCYIRSQERDDSCLGKLYREGDVSEHVHSYCIIYLSQCSFEMGWTMIIYPQCTRKETAA